MSWRGPLAKGARRSLRLAVVSLPLFVYMRCAVDPRLVYHLTCPIFRTDAAFLAEHAARPGGVTEGLAGLVSQAYVQTWAGPAVITATILLTCLAGGAYVSALGGHQWRWVGLLAAAPLAVLHSRYVYLLQDSLAAAVVLAAAAAYVLLRLRASVHRSAVFAIAAVVLYQLAGAPMLLFAVLAALWELLGARRWAPALAGAAAAAAVPYLAATWSETLTVARAYVLRLPFRSEFGWTVALVVLYAMFPLMAVATALRGPVRSLAAAVRRRVASGGSAPAERSVSAARRAVWWAAGTLVPLAAWAAAGWVSLDTARRSSLRIDYLAARRNWAGVLREADRLALASFTAETTHNVDLALFHTGQLPERMFAYPHRRQLPGLTLLEGKGVSQYGRAYVKVGDLMFELGYVNEAEHMAHEAVELLGERPQLLERLALIYVLKDQPVAAATYLAALEKHLLHRRWARRYARLLREDPRLEMLEDVRRIRRRMPTTDTMPWPNVEQRLLLLLQADPTNRMAFEYLMGYWLLTGQVNRVAQHIGRLRGFGQQVIPRLYEEALLTYAYHLQMRRRPNPTRLDGLRMRPGARQRLAEFLKARAAAGADRQAARRMLERQFPGSYYVYYAFGMTTGGRE